MLTVCCVLSKGGKYDEGHVEYLDHQVRKHIKQKYRFVYIDDSPWKGWWAKISLFQPGRFTGRVLYLDLDVTIKGSLDDLANVDLGPFHFVTCKDWFRFGFNSSVMLWEAGKVDYLYTDFNPERDIPAFFRGGDQSWIFHKVPGANKFPPNWIQSFKAAIMKGGFDPDLHVVVWHGWPKSWEVREYV